MASLYTSLQVSPRKKRCPPDSDDDTVATPKKLRRLPQTPKSISSSNKEQQDDELPDHLDRLLSIQGSLLRALSHALATCAVSPTSDRGLVPNVLNNHTLTAAAGLNRTCTLDDIKRLCWLWEWDAKGLPSPSMTDEDNPFLDELQSDKPKQWQRGAMGLIITPTTYLPKSTNKRIPAYGIGIEVEMDIDKEMIGGMAAIARWTSKSGARLKEVTAKLRRWVEFHQGKKTTVPQLPMADIPSLIIPAPKQSALTQRLASLSPKSPKSLSSASSRLPESPSSPSRPSSPTKPRVMPGKRTERDFAIPFPITPSSIPRKTSIPSLKQPSTPQTPRRHLSSICSSPLTPANSSVSGDTSPERPDTPVRQTGSAAETAPSTPSTSRRAALYERIRKRSESQAPETPSKMRISTSKGLSRDQLMKLGQEEQRRRCLLGRLGSVAESIWMLFNSPANGTSPTASPRKRRAIPTSQVVPAIIKSSPVPISSAEALESITLLTSLCPFFLKSIEVGGEDWLEMPASATQSLPTLPTSSPRKAGSDEELKTLSPRRVKRESGGLREVREKIKKELEASEQ